MANQPMFQGATPLIFKRAESLRDRMTNAENILWEELRLNKLNAKFRRQHPLSQFIVDFYCHKYKLVIELDGGIHLRKDVREYDKAREEEIIRLGLKVIRFKNSEVLNSIDFVVCRIREAMAEQEIPLNEESNK